ncbi:hypothetical protein [Chromobacterium alticapitis]|uniref:Uncharacterized protein n=1 Tax=Chromobacterium alticapitis TaxID=2073169 RepID=A0A2S5DHF4_9NEIS|nr:hypothetical protein [Chromobacterium alticapitis]POZ62447.1 hypothetical protein C2I19_08090 [Chromobacterium alticapitis]
MSPAEASHILSALANGVDPSSGEPLPANDVFNQPDVIRALFLAERALHAFKPQRGAPGNAGREWTEDEEARLLQAYDAGAELKQIAADHARSRGAIAARLAKLGRLAPDADASFA